MPHANESGDFAIWYTPGVAARCRAIHEDPERVYELTSKANTISVVSDGSRVLGLGDLGPEAGLPAMEGKALLSEMAIAAAAALARAAELSGLKEERIVPRMDDWEVFPQIAVATAMKAQQLGVAALSKTKPQLLREAFSVIRQARDATHLLMREGLIAAPIE